MRGTIESLEPRRLLAVVQLTADGTLVVTGTDAADRIFAAPGGTVIVNGTPHEYQDYIAGAIGAIQRVEIRGGGGDDHLLLAESHFPFDPKPTIILDGGDGNDTFDIGDATGSVVGGRGDDVVNLLWEAQLLAFDDVSGVDTINARNALGSQPSLSAMPWIENEITQYDLTLDRRFFSRDPLGGSHLPQDADGNATLSGTDGPDEILIYILRPYPGPGAYAVINGVPRALYWDNMTNGTLTVLGKDGDDRIEMRASGMGVRAHFDGGDGNDTLLGGSYNDILIGGRGKDLFFARDGNADVIDGGKGNDKAEVDDQDELIDVKGKKNLKAKRN